MLDLIYIYHCKQVPIGPFRYKAILNHRQEPKQASIEALFHLPQHEKDPFCV